MSEPLRSSGTSLLTPGELVAGRYAIEEVLGQGGMAAVYRARHVGLEHQVALKVVLPSVRSLPGVAERFLREARAATRLKSDHVARVFDVGLLDDGTPFFVMELLEGRDLGSLVSERGALAPVTAVAYVLQACEALAEVHGIGIVHRDLKPGNLFLTRGADGLPHVKLIDFGISRLDVSLADAEPSSLTQPGGLMGSPRYMAPEQMEDAARSDVRSDIWGLGAVLYELLTGEPPYDGASFLDIYAAALRGPPPGPSTRRGNVPHALDAVVFRCLAADPARRFADVDELARALVPFGPPGSDAVAQSIDRVLRSARARAGGPPVLPEPLRTQLDDPRRGRARRVRERDVPLDRPRRGRGVWLGLALVAALVAGGVRAWSAKVGGRDAPKTGDHEQPHEAEKPAAMTEPTPATPAAPSEPTPRTPDETASTTAASAPNAAAPLSPAAAEVATPAVLSPAPAAVKPARGGRAAASTRRGRANASHAPAAPPVTAPAPSAPPVIASPPATTTAAEPAPAEPAPPTTSPAPSGNEPAPADDPSLFEDRR